MSTRANVLIKDDHDELWFYRHSDGYPECTKTSLEVFMGWLKDGRIRNNVGQAAGWLILLGADEYQQGNVPLKEGYSGWKCGAYEPTTGQHGDIEYLYTIDLNKQTLEVKDIYE